MLLGLGADPRRVVIVVGRVRIPGEPVIVRTGIVRSSSTHRVALRFG